ncbi:MAG: hypothetical protein L0Z07_10120, partial [Planctomycetes bacterium]|nr:hypothetical protein [Planctomycetota bacterium]
TNDRCGESPAVGISGGHSEAAAISAWEGRFSGCHAIEAATSITDPRLGAVDALKSVLAWWQRQPSPSTAE